MSNLNNVLNTIIVTILGILGTTTVALITANRFGVELWITIGFLLLAVVFAFIKLIRTRNKQKAEIDFEDNDTTDKEEVKSELKINENDLFGSKDDFKKDISILENHSLFYSTEEKLFELKFINFNDKKREKIAKNVLSIKYQTMRERWKQFIEGNKDKIENNQIEAKDVIAELKMQFSLIESKAIQENIPDLVIKKYGAYHSTSLLLLFDSINDVYNKKDISIENGIDKLKICFYLINMFVELTYKDLVTTFSTINGELETYLREM